MKNGMNETDRERYATLAADVGRLDPEDLDDLALNALTTTTGMLRLMTGETLAQFNDGGRLLALSALLDVAQEQLNKVRAAIAVRMLMADK